MGALNENSIELHINGKKEILTVPSSTSLLDALREYLHLTGTKKGCDHGQCGACTVLVDGKAINSCLALAKMQEDKDIVTIEGIAEDGELNKIQQAFIEHDAFQCGYCTSGQICSMVGMLNMDKHNSPEEIRDVMSGNICRCGAYANIYKVAEMMQESKTI